MFFPFGCWLNFSMTLKNKHCSEKKKDGITFCFEWFSSTKNMPTKRVESYTQWDRQRETHCWKPDRMEKEKREEKGGDELEWKRSKFPSYFPPLFLLNTEKFTFFPHKSAWTVCFRKKNIFHWQSHWCLQSVITGMEGKRHPFGETILEERGAGGDWSGGLLWTTVLHPTAFGLWAENRLSYCAVFSCWPQWPSHPSL